jgi:hypothetical protein
MPSRTYIFTGRLPGHATDTKSTLDREGEFDLAAARAAFVEAHPGITGVHFHGIEATNSELCARSEFTNFPSSCYGYPA